MSVGDEIGGCGGAGVTFGAQASRGKGADVAVGQSRAAGPGPGVERCAPGCGSRLPTRWGPVVARAGRVLVAMGAEVVRPGLCSRVGFRGGADPGGAGPGCPARAREWPGPGREEAAWQDSGRGRGPAWRWRRGEVPGAAAWLMWSSGDAARAAGLGSRGPGRYRAGEAYQAAGLGCGSCGGEWMPRWRGGIPGRGYPTFPGLPGLGLRV